MNTNLVEKATQMCEYVNRKLGGLAKQDYVMEVKWNPCWTIRFGYFVEGRCPNGICTPGAYIEYDDHGCGTYYRVFADITSYYGGWSGGRPNITPIVHGERPRLFNEKAVRETMLAWSKIKDWVEEIVANELAIANFEI